MYRLSKNFCIAPDRNGRLAGFLRDSGSRLNLQSWFYRALLDLGQGGAFTESAFATALTQHFPTGEPIPDPSELLHELVRLGVFWPAEQWNRFEAANAPPWLDWEKHGWVSAKLFHDSIVYSKFLMGDSEGRREQLEASEDIHQSGEGPPPVKFYPNVLQRVPLPQSSPPLQKNFAHVLLRRRTCRLFESARPITRDVLASILFHAAKAQMMCPSRYFGVEIKRTTPSGGSRHPVEIYPQVFDSPDGMDGSFYYDCIEHSLVRLGDTAREHMYELCQRQVALTRNFLVFLVTVRFARNYWKYRYPKSYLFSLFDVGHFVQTLILVCEASGLRCFLTPALDVEAAQRHLGLENIYDECPVYFLVAGYSSDAHT